MTDPLSVASGVAGIISLAGFVINQCYQYGCGVANAPEEAKRLVSELTGLSGVLVGVQGLIKSNDPAAYRVGGLLQDCKALLESIALKLQKQSPSANKSSSNKIINRLLWPLRRDDTQQMILTLERHKHSLALALDTISIDLLIDQTQSLGDIRNAFNDLRIEIKSDRAAQERQDVLDWLSEYQHDTQYRRGCQIHCTETCNWLLTHPEIIKWFQYRSSLLWMYGKAGSGKTVATSYLINHLTSHPTADGAMLAYFYYDASTIESLTPETVFGSIVKQLCSQMKELPHKIIDAYKRATIRQGTPKQPTLPDLMQYMHVILEGQHPLTIVVDALDEASDYATVCEFLTSVVESGRYSLRVFISSRPEVDLRRRFARFQNIPIPENSIESDIKIYIKTRIENDARLRRMSLKMQQHVELTLKQGSNAMFRWVQCQLDELSRLRTDAALKRALNQLPPTLEESYSRILQNIGPDDALYAKRALLWLAHSSAPLTLPELAQAVIFDGEFDWIDPDSELIDPNDILEICGSLINFSTTSRTIRIAHHSVREFLTQRLNQASPFFLPAPTSHRTIAEVCISYLLLEDFDAGPLTLEDLKWTLSKFPLLRYAAHRWTFHVEMSGAEKELQPLILRLMSKDVGPNFFFWLQVVLFDSRHGYLPPNGELNRARPLYYAASYGLTETVRSLVAAQVDMNEKAGRYGGTALHAAVWRRRKECIRILLNAGADTKIPDSNGANPAELALWSGYRDGFQLFPQDPNSDTGLSRLISTVIQNRENALAMSNEEWEIAQEYEKSNLHSADASLQVLGQVYGEIDKDGRSQDKGNPTHDLQFSAIPREEYQSAKAVSEGQVFEMG